MALAIVNDGADLAAMAAVGVHYPNVLVFHGGFPVGETPLGGRIGDGFAIRGPARGVFVTFRCREAADGAVGDTKRKDVVIEKLVGIGFAIRDEKNFFAVGRPVDGMFIVGSLRELARLMRGHVHDKNVQAAIVVESGHAFACSGLVEVARDYHGIAAGFGGFRTRSGRDERDLFAVGRPGHTAALARERGV